ncbi:apoptosis inhibitor 5 homolog [Phlebotomus argentipes]|uniref:apoptosis inhibitor 5 homolog n=1 Tax=Phlebotomus argentipes TaxID=94469 RepID=UPI0028934C27|nr:apoptosis inhibitor 5 homolog [Phlebotomus argentipes]
MDKVEKLYQNYEILSSAGEKVLEHEDLFVEMLDAVKGSSKEKILASQFIGKFFKHFPSLQELAIDRQLDLCEDSDPQIRRQAIKDLPQLCKDTKENIPKIADSLAQLLLLDGTELIVVYFSLQTLAKLDAKLTLTGVISQIITGDEQTREKCFKYIQHKFRNYAPDIYTKEIEEYLVAELKKILHDVTSDEFQIIMTILGSTKLGKTVTGHAELVNLAVEQAELGADIDPVTLEDETIERFIQCATHALPYFSTQIESTPFVKFICDKLLPINSWNMISAADDQSQVHLRILKIFAEMCTNCGTLDNGPQRIEAIFTVLMEFLPLPPMDDTDVLSASPSFQFSHVECLLYALHTLGKHGVEFFTFHDDPEKLKDFRARLQYLARGTQGYIKRLQESVKDKKDDTNSEENKIKVTALKTTSNISALIRDLFHSPPSFKTKVTLSWIEKKETAQQREAKRHAPITFDGKSGGPEVKKVRGNTNGTQKVYTPPSGKYSGRVRGGYGGGQRQGGMGRNRQGRPGGGKWKK